MKQKVTTITPRAMTLIEYDAFINFLNSPEFTKSKNQGWDIMKWILEKVYGQKFEECEIKPGTLMTLAKITQELSEESEIEDVKNLKQSGVGE